MPSYHEKKSIILTDGEKKRCINLSKNSLTLFWNCLLSGKNCTIPENVLVNFFFQFKGISESQIEFRRIAYAHTFFFGKQVCICNGLLHELKLILKQIY